MSPEYVGPTKIVCPLACDVPAGVKMSMVPPPRHNWADVLHCPNEDCGRHFLVLREPDGAFEGLRSALGPDYEGATVWDGEEPL